MHPDQVSHIIISSVVPPSKNPAPGLREVLPLSPSSSGPASQDRPCPSSLITPPTRRPIASSTPLPLRALRRTLHLVDFGTAPPSDVISARGEYLGGAISPASASAPTPSSPRAARLGPRRHQAPRQSHRHKHRHPPPDRPLLRHIGLVTASSNALSPSSESLPAVIATGGLAARSPRLRASSPKSTTCSPSTALLILFERNRAPRSRGRPH